eukprot:NODE_2775_length_1042_cov_140.122860_g2320_i0.p2 GENE.NODE_2775_length_1042_cov_140.122860_g2320_i0~~NODE_2775_length_1042_cov_140.122860_g2320_i0.p2  ORF type:complete len:299 (-),score=141.90 NODE_2775_length_1042_cov_140.122860_g2320_i0:43-939(-)
MAEKARVLALVDAQADKDDLRSGLARFEFLNEEQYEILNSIEAVREFVRMGPLTRGELPSADKGKDAKGGKKGGEAPKPKGGDKKGADAAKGGDKPEAAAKGGDKAGEKKEKAPKENATTKACKKEGGKKGAGLADMNGMGGISYFTVNVDEPKEWRYFDACMEAMNVEPEGDAGEERKGGAGSLAKLVLAGSPDLFMMVCENPKELAEAKGVTTREWVDAVLKDINGWEELSTSETRITGQIKTNPDKDIFPLKIRDQVTGSSFQFLRVKGVIPDADGDDDWVPDEDAMEEAGIGSW